MRLLGLDTLAPDGADAGVLGERQLAWVADRLGRDDKRPVLIFMHHPPFSLGLPLDWTRCADGDDLAQLVPAHPRVLGVICGHVHRAARLAWAGTIGGVCPPVAWEIPLDLAPGAAPYLVPQSPAFQLHVVDPELGLVSHSQYVTVERLFRSGGSAVVSTATRRESAMTRARDDTAVFASYNIHKCVGVDRRFDPDRVASGDRRGRRRRDRAAGGRPALRRPGRAARPGADRAARPGWCRCR